MKIRTCEVANRLKKDLKLKRKVRAPQLNEYAKQLNCKGDKESSNGAFFYMWTENEYQELLKIFEP